MTVAYEAQRGAQTLENAISTSRHAADRLAPSETIWQRAKMQKNKNTDNGHFSSSYSLEDPEDTKEHYKSWAATYDKEVGEDNEYAQPQRCADTLKRHLAPGDSRILDAGCGSGLSGSALAAAGYTNIDGCDFSPDMLALAKDKGVYANLFEADLNAGQPTIANETYDAVTAVGVFSFGHVSPDACDDLLRLVKQGGFFVIALNEKFWDEGSLPRKIEQLESLGGIEVLSREYGDHLPGHNVNGWVIAMRKR